MIMESLSEKQQRFSFLVGQLLLWVGNRGWGVTFGEAYRTPEQAALNAQKGTGIANSLHTKRLAIDLNLFKDGVYKTNSEDYKEMGEYWESLDTDCVWGGRFKDSRGNPKPDGNHFSLRHDGVA